MNKGNEYKINKDN